MATEQAATERQDEGWYGPEGSRRFHFFTGDPLRSLCGKWMLWAHPEAVGSDWGRALDFACNGDCADCDRRLARREEAKANV